MGLSRVSIRMRYLKWNVVGEIVLSPASRINYFTDSPDDASAMGYLATHSSATICKFVTSS